MIVTRVWFRTLGSASILFLVGILWYLRHTRYTTVQVHKSSFDWSQVKYLHHAQPEVGAVSGATRILPKIQHRFERSSNISKKQRQRRDVILSTFKKCWRNYRTYAWKQDELLPISAGGKNSFGGWAATLIDSLDTLWIMGLKEEFFEAVGVVASLDWNSTPETSCSVFETTIRHLGGLLSAYDLSGHDALLQKAVELGDMLITSFNTPSGLPASWLDFEKAKTGQLEAGFHEPSTSAGSLALEFTRLSQVTRDPKYYNMVTKVAVLMQQSQNQTKLPGMWPANWNLATGNFVSDNSFTIGAFADSTYEYLPKMFALTGGADTMYAQMYRTAAEAITNSLLYRPTTPNEDDVLFAGSVWVESDGSQRLNPEGQHLSCFIGGMYGVGGKLIGDESHVELGLKLTKGCIWAYNAFASGIMPENFNLVACPSIHGPCPWDEEKWRQKLYADFDGHDDLPKGFTNARVPTYLLRPEAIESVFIMYRITGREELLDAAWTMFQAIDKATSTPYGNAAIEDVGTVGSRQRDSMESFWLAETLKYLYLIFSPPDGMSLDEWVFNTEAHPFRRPRGSY
ncbi:Mannosyl-oligosaccharide 1,2-alpha-mannosidase MNS1 [Cyphellophora attinorum]|uniref:alpha-1,2-Mannosidase n=1 Tax=Cyphellophora attinorum TaxID=1664694 RepID=A0A0N0NMJ7_9EURO|nr:Mannosyl-oligosaccharide 1,2-alpha-mannosidase MNS1 [Phialophora attinorum]KPI40541.1 Mannosyl-oligosaccharide 1,2-alpha-mannosidase MNS1 [Phialophora attinorum]